MQREAERARQLYEAWNEGGVDAMVADFWHEDIVWHDAPDFPDSTTHEGREAVAQYLRGIVGVVGHFHLTVGDVQPADDAVVAELTLEGQGGASGLPVSTPLWHVLEFRDDRVIRCRAFLDGDRAQAAAAA